MKTELQKNMKCRVDWKRQGDLRWIGGSEEEILRKKMDLLDHLIHMITWKIVISGYFKGLYKL